MVKKSREKFKIYKNVFDEFTLSTLFRLSSQRHFDDLLMPVMIGKESNVFLADTADDYVIVKIYRLESCNFNKMYSYIKSDPRFMGLKNQRRQVIFKWVQREYRNLLTAREKINVPTPIAFRNNVLIMESIGSEKPAPQLKDSLPKDMEKFLKSIIDSVGDLIELGIVHADLSEYNILNHREKPYFIDFSQSTSVKDRNAAEYLERDMKNIKRFFAKHGVQMDDSVTENLKRKLLNKTEDSQNQR
ncbi:TPA: serine protein kinase RIO [Candidatus Woesearchaeota archaeon]|nr:Serine/threonine protein kinase involved in cell cycle control [archaeon GW2011_AR15]MBS3103812.1 serine protein kinase RIO [Candidatus Woesearchaeota archaeon]HIH41898.1 serine protein kinase RIO [Candidatus Woesearchaeota archaeon]